MEVIPRESAFIELRGLIRNAPTELVASFPRHVMPLPTQRQVLVVSLLPPPITGQEARWGMPFADQIRADRDITLQFDGLTAPISVPRTASAAFTGDHG